LFGRNIVKDYKKENKNMLELLALEKIHYNVYIFLNPRNNNRLYKDLQKNKMDSYIMECDKYEIVIGVDILEPLTSTAISDFTGMYIRDHPNAGIGTFDLGICGKRLL
jgi:hypothetical protein